MTNKEFENNLVENINTISKKINVSSMTSKTFAVAVSGGSDSLSLAIGMHFAGFKVLGIVVDHNLRASSADEAKYVKKLLTSFGIEVVVLKWKEKPKKNLEQDARNARYDLLLKECKKRKIDFLCVGHHLDDQVETFLLNLARGSGLDGLCAMPQVKKVDDVFVIRPILNLNKQDCRDYLTSKNIKWCDDESNNDTTFKRNKLRFLLNSIEDKNLITARVCGSISTLQEVKEIVDDLISKTFDECVKINNGVAFIDVDVFTQQKKYIQKSIITRILMNFSNAEHKPRLYQIENIVNKINGLQDFKCTLMKCAIELKNTKKTGKVLKIWRLKN